MTAANLDRLPTLADVGDTCSGEAGTRDPMNMTDPAALADRRAAMFEAAEAAT